MFCQKNIKIKELGIKNIFSLSKKQSYFFFSCFPYLEYFFSLILEQSDFLPPPDLGYSETNVHCIGRGFFFL